MRVRGRLEHRIAQRAKEHGSGCDEDPRAQPCALRRRDQVEREEQHAKEKTLVVREDFNAREAEQLRKWRAEQEDMRGEMMGVKAEVVDPGRIAEQRIAGLKQVGEPATVFEVPVAREVREDPPTMRRKD